MQEDIIPDKRLDCRGLSCPMPILKTKKAIAKMKPDQILEVIGTDPGTINDMPSFAQRAGHEYLGEKTGRGFTLFYIKVK